MNEDLALARDANYGARTYSCLKLLGIICGRKCLNFANPEAFVYWVKSTLHMHIFSFCVWDSKNVSSYMGIQIHTEMKC